MKKPASVQFFYGLTAKPATRKGKPITKQSEMGLMANWFCFWQLGVNLEGRAGESSRRLGGAGQPNYPLQHHQGHAGQGPHPGFIR